MTELESAARAYVLARESGQLTTTRYRRLRTAWVAAVRADAIMQKLRKPAGPVREPNDDR